ncbi:MAG: cob(I)yrinic acid a,c-diamide adenosyltransferase [Verrucomicrobia bacterium]|nr:cob(I)yrinic acid a,c-diamide adenosyltransferase [Verrucomicrobiota bacterium]MDE3099958.1 cob(I)yrinic acid a,c-diamide adenosyltransferase [Verrucomicrobiota bacterium]
MSIVTRTGDSGTTGLMFGRRVPKNHPRVEAYGAVDELNAALGMARATGGLFADRLVSIQKELVTVMGELCVHPGDLARYQRDGYTLVTRPMTARLEQWIQEVESQNVSPNGWATPGATRAAAALDVSRTVCRRAERRVCGLQETGEPVNGEIIIYLNRLGDLLWLLARAQEKAENGAKQAKTMPEVP